MNELLQSAMHIKQAEVDRERPRFLASPMHLQATLFHDAATTSWRRRPLEERIVEARRRIQSAKEAMREQSAAQQSPSMADGGHALLRTAQRTYEEAYGLFVYIEGCGGDIRTRGIKDADLTFVDDVMTAPIDEGAAARAFVEARQLVVGLLCNYAIVCKHMGLGGGLAEAAVAVLREANRRDPLHLRAAYLLAKQLQAHAASAELDESIAILSHALTTADGVHGPEAIVASEEHVRDARTLLDALKTERDMVVAQKRKTAKRFLASSADGSTSGGTANGLCNDVGAPVSDSRRSDSPTAVQPTVSPLSDGPLKGDWYAQAELCRCTIDRMRRDGQQREAQQLDQQLREACAEKLFVECLRPKRLMDIGRLPDDAKAFCQRLGIDPATDTLVQAHLQRRVLSHFNEELPNHHMTLLEVELMLFSMGLVKSTELNDADARNRHNELFVTKSAAAGLVPVEPILAGLNASYVERYGRELRAKLQRAWAAKSK